MISKSEVEGREWLLTRADSHDILGLHEDGSISGSRFAHTVNSWNIEGETLTIANHLGRPVYTLQATDEGGFSGTYSRRGEKFECALTLNSEEREKTHYRERGWDRILIEQRLGGSREFLLVKFNSLGKPFRGVLGDWEMYHLPNQLSVDYLRFSASELPRSWYLDKFDVIMAQLRAAVSMGYKRIVMVGMSAGGYAAIASAEKLAEEFPDIEISSISFNPTLLVSDKHYDRLMEFPDGVRSTLCTPENYKRRQIDKADISDLLEKQGKAQHIIHYDSLNPFEAYQIGFLPALDRLTIIPHELGVNHGAGTIRIYKSGIIHEQLRALMPDALYPTPEEISARKV